MDIPDIKYPRVENLHIIISQILSASNSEVNLDELFKYIHMCILKLMPAKNFYIALYDKTSNIITFPYYIDEFDDEAPAKKFGKGLTEYIIRTGKSILLTQETHRELEVIGEIETVGTPSKVWLGVPLSIQDKIIGVFVVQDYHSEEAYSNKEKEILELISYPISRAIERKKVEQEREELINKLKELNNFKDKLFSLISHDLRGPFNSLLGFSEILVSEYGILTDEEIKEYLNVIYESSKNLYGMTNNLLQFSRFQMGRIEYHPVSIEIGLVAAQALNMLRGNILKKQINIFSSIPNTYFVLGDEDMLNSILQNVISNAIKFTPRGGDIFITAKKHDSDKGNFTEVIVRDTGVGMGSETLSKLFTNDISSMPGTEKEYGTGLGLMLTKDFVDRQGGTIKVKSELNEGTIFSFTIPSVQCDKTHA